MVAIVNYGVGNLTSILNMHKRLAIDAIITSDEEVIKNSEKLLLPGIGHFDKCMQNFNESGLRPIVEQKVFEENTSVLGICVGAQMMTRGSDEGMEEGLQWVEADTILFKQQGETNFKVPHMGWTDLDIVNPSPLWNNLPENPRFYFAHSYHFAFDSNEFVTGNCHYGYNFTCAFRRDNIFGVQFHPEKSHKFGMQLLANFASL